MTYFSIAGLQYHYQFTNDKTADYFRDFFTYEKDYEQVALIIKRPLMIEDIVIPFADIKEMAICGNINDANRRMVSTNQIKYSAYIQSILECCPDEVRHYVNNASNTTGYAL